MTKPDMGFDTEDVAALLDGTLSESDRARVLKVLAHSDVALEAFAETARFKFQASQQDAVVPIPLWRKTGWRRLALPVAAAAALFLVVGPLMMRSMLAPGIGPLSGSQLASALGPPTELATTLGPNWDDRTWSVTRGAAARLVEPEIAFRLGARAVDLQVALRLDDRQRAESLVSEMRQWLDGVAMAQPVTARYAELQARLAAAMSTVIDLADSAERALDDFLDSPRFTFGKWCAAAELAARAKRVSFFELDLTRDFLNEAAGLGLADEDIETLRRIAATVRDSPGNADLEELRELLQTIIVRNAG